MSPIDHEKAAQYAPGKGVLVTLTPKERELINAAMADYRRNWVFTPAELEIMDNLMRRIPKDTR